MDQEIELTYRLTGHLIDSERVIATLLSSRNEIYAATDRRVLGLTKHTIGYRLRVHPYSELRRVCCFEEDGEPFVQFSSIDGELTVQARSRKEAEGFVASVAGRVGSGARAPV